MNAVHEDALERGERIVRGQLATRGSVLTVVPGLPVSERSRLVYVVGVPAGGEVHFPVDGCELGIMSFEQAIEYFAARNGHGPAIAREIAALGANGDSAIVVLDREVERYRVVAV